VGKGREVGSLNREGSGRDNGKRVRNGENKVVRGVRRVGTRGGRGGGGRRNGGGWGEREKENLFNTGGGVWKCKGEGSEGERGWVSGLGE